MSLTVHCVTPDDWRSHRDLRLEMLTAAPDAFLTRYDDVAGFDEPTWRERIATQCHFQARLDEEVVGSVGVWDDPDTPDDAVTLVAMYVTPRARGTGVAQRLVEAVFAEAARRGRSRVVLEVTEGNEPATRLYERMGFAYDGTRHPLPHTPDLYERGMERALDTPLPGPPPAWEADAMTDVTVRSLGEEDWREFKAIRLAALRDSPDAFVATAEDEEGFEEDFWRLRLRRSTRLVAVRQAAEGSGGQPVGVVSLGEGKDEEGRVAEIFGLWVAPAARGTGVATKLVEASADRARRDGRTHVSYWVGTDNGRAVAFASGIGFRPTDFRRPMRVASTNGAEPDDDLPEEIAMVLPLGEDRGRPDVL